MSKHIELFHKDKEGLFDKDKKSAPKQPSLKRQLTSFTCSKCNSTFDNKHRMKSHIKAQHEGKHTFSPERKVNKQFQEEDTTKKDNNKGDNIERGETVQIDRNELENLQDLLLQSGQENEQLKRRMICMEEENIKLYNEKKVL